MKYLIEHHNRGKLNNKVKLHIFNKLYNKLFDQISKELWLKLWSHFYWDILHHCNNFGVRRSCNNFSMAVTAMQFSFQSLQQLFHGSHRCNNSFFAVTATTFLWQWLQQLKGPFAAPLQQRFHFSSNCHNGSLCSTQKKILDFSATTIKISFPCSENDFIKLSQ